MRCARFATVVRATGAAASQGQAEWGRCVTRASIVQVLEHRQQVLPRLHLCAPFAFRTIHSGVGSRRRRKQPPPFLTADLSPQSAEDAVNNILYNSPPASAAPVTRHVLNCLVSNEPGVLSHVSGTLAGRGFNIESLVVAKTEVPDLSRMTIVLHGQKVVIEQARRQLEDMIPVWAVLDYTHGRILERELLLVKVSTVPREHVEEFEIEGHETDETTERPSLSPLLSAALQRQAITDLARLFNARVVDVSVDGLTLELSAKPDRVDAFMKLLKPYGIVEAARSGAMAMPRSPVDGVIEDDDVAVADEEEGDVDATMLPPG